MRFTKRKNKADSGQVRRAESYSIRVDGADTGTIQKSPAGWFWYGLGHNTLARDWEESKYASREYRRVFTAAEEALEDFKKFYLEKQ